MTIEAYEQAMTGVRSVLRLHAAQPKFLPRSLELGDKTRAAAPAALHARVNLPAVSAELGRLAAEALPHDRAEATEAGRAMARWAAREYYGALGLDVDQFGP